MGRLFGTDGVRGVANTELTAELALSIGRACAQIFASEGKRARIVIGCDTRRSSDMLTSAISAGVCSAGADAITVGTVTTPEVAYLVRRLCADAAIMISASHNPSEYNGIKIFSGSGYKLADALEDKIEATVFGSNENINTSDVGRVISFTEADELYAGYLKSTVKNVFNGLKVAIDCANGSASAIAPTVFSELGAEVVAINSSPNGDNINENCGSTHMEALIRHVKENGCDVGFAFDGDADRCLCVDGCGEVIDGDMILAICALDMKRSGRLKNDTVVGTVMSNFGFIRFCKENGINFISTKVGDRYVLEDMLLGDHKLGGEQSGHIIFSEFATTGDGILTALQVLDLVKRSNTPLSELKKVMKRAPQELINVTVSSEGKVRFYTVQRISEAIRRAEEELGDNGRIVVRPSGTEPLIRVMAEGSDQAQIKNIAIDIATVIKEELK